MSEVSILGLGTMGAALAKRLLETGLQVTAWNRTAHRCNEIDRLQVGELRIDRVPDALAAVQASPVILVCVTHYEAANAILLDNRIQSALRGKLIVQLSSGTPEDARKSNTWATEHGIDYLDAVIMATPMQIGSPEAAIFTSGAKDSWHKAQPILSQLAQNVSYLGEQPGLAATVDLAILSYLFSALLGFYHGASIYRAEGLSIASFGETIGQLGPTLTQMVKHEAEIIAADAYHQVESSVSIVAETAATIVRHAHEAGINDEVPAFEAHMFAKAVDAGFGKQQVAALLKTLGASHD